MAGEFKNLGKAQVDVTLLTGLPHIRKKPGKYVFDVSAFDFPRLKNSGYFPPLFIDHVEDPDGSFAALFPSRRKVYVDNIIGWDDYSSDLPYIKFKAISTREGYPSDLFNDFDSYTLVQPGNYVDGDSDYIGPKWKTAVLSNLTRPNDLLTLKKWFNWVYEGDELDEDDDDDDRSFTIPKLYSLNQHVVKDGLWWGVESEDFLYENQPFWITMKADAVPTSRDHETVFIVSLGIGDDDQSYDVIFKYNQRPSIIDYYKGRGNFSGGTASGDQPTFYQKEYDIDAGRILDTDEDIEIGFMTIAGRLVVFVNNSYMVYNRIIKTDDDEDGIFKEAKISPGRIRIYGSNVMARINVSPMSFAPLAMMALSIPVSYGDDGNQIGIIYKGRNYKGEEEGTTAHLATEPEHPGQKYGVDCDEYEDPSGTALPSGDAFHHNGKITLTTSDDAFTNSILGESKYYVLGFLPRDMISNEGTPREMKIPWGGCPYLFRIAGLHIRDATIAHGTKVCEDVISVSQSNSAPDYFHLSTTATVELYNKDGKYDYLKSSQHGVRIKWGWDNVGGDYSFTGIITSANTSEVAGKEIITLQCEDYMHILKSTPIINSPFYDGMVGYYAVKDLAERIGIDDFVKEWDNEDDYFLPSGYAFSKPAMRFPSRNTIFNCIMEIVKRFEAFVYFDGEGKFHIKLVPGGLFSEFDGAAQEFKRDPDDDEDNILLNQKNVEQSFASTVNNINIVTLDRDTRQWIVHNHTATSLGDRLLFRKIHMYDQPALGDLETAKVYARRLGRRMFKPMIKTGFQVIGQSGVPNIMDFIKVDGQEFRIMSLARKYSADNNDFTLEYGCEWLGG